jgi:hypothetical protein
MPVQRGPARGQPRIDGLLYLHARPIWRLCLYLERLAVHWLALFPSKVAPSELLIPRLLGPNSANQDLSRDSPLACVGGVPTAIGDLAIGVRAGVLDCS